MKMIHHCLVACDGFEDVVVRESQDRLARLLTVRTARIEVDRHPLQSAGGRVEEGEILDILRILFTFGLANAEAKTSVTILAVPDVTQVRLHLAREEEGVRRRECSQRASSPLGDEHTICRLQGNDGLILHATELVALLVAARVAPGDPGSQLG